MDSSGNYLWAKSFGGALDDYGQSITADNYGNTYITGFFDGAGDFDPGPDTVNLTSVGDHDIFIARFSGRPAPICTFSATPTFTKTKVNYTNPNSGSITINTVGGGSSPYNYKWSNGSYSQSATGLSAGSHNLTITDNYGCTFNTSVNIQVTDVLEV
jgi:hypothetical protein